MGALSTTIKKCATHHGAHIYTDQVGPIIFDLNMNVYHFYYFIYLFILVGCRKNSTRRSGKCNRGSD